MRQAPHRASWGCNDRYRSISDELAPETALKENIAEELWAHGDMQPLKWCVAWRTTMLLCVVCFSPFWPRRYILLRAHDQKVRAGLWLCAWYLAH